MAKKILLASLICDTSTDGWFDEKRLRMLELSESGGQSRIRRRRMRRRSFVTKHSAQVVVVWWVSE